MSDQEGALRRAVDRCDRAATRLVSVAARMRQSGSCEDHDRGS
jgi:hypothetical protein